MTNWRTTKRYQDHLQARRAMDYSAQARIVEEALKETHGAEQLFWRWVQYESRVGKLSRERLETEQAWAQLPDLLAMAPDDPYNRWSVAIATIRLLLMTQRTDLWARYFPLVKPYWRQAMGRYPMHANLGLLRAQQRRWHGALYCFTKALTEFDQLTPEHQESQRGSRCFVHAERARAAAAIGNLNLARADLRAVASVEATLPEGYLAPCPLALARAEVALVEGDLQGARTLLQGAMAHSATTRIKPPPQERIEFDLIAARIARAEGNQPSFRHFTERALATAVEWNLQLSRAAVEAVMAGAER